MSQMIKKENVSYFRNNVEAIELDTSGKRDTLTDN